MPLYNNILLSRKNDGKDREQSKSNPSASMKMLQDHLLSKRRLQQQDSTSKFQKSSNSKSSQIISESVLHQPSENDWELEDEYDPMIPNNYESLHTEFLKAEELRITNRLKPTSIRKTIPNMLDVLDKLEDAEDHDRKHNRGSAIAPPPSLLSSLADISKANSSSEKQDASGSVAAKIMSKMGYKLGQGLGKDEQGINSPLEVEKSGVNTGRIVSGKKELLVPDNAPATTKVILLQNMVGPGEVDEDLEAETKEECKKYGDVSRCLIYEMPNKRVADDEAVRIFVEFRKVESAIKAVSDLNGRFFGGRVVRASFYNLDRFNKYELGPEV